MSFLRTILIKNDCQLKQRELLTANWFMNIAWERYDMHEIGPGTELEIFWNEVEKIFSKQFGGNISL